MTFRALALRSDEGLTLETSSLDSLDGGKFTLSTQLIKPNYLLKLFADMFSGNSSNFGLIHHR